LNPLFANMGTSVFEVFSGLAREHGAINLGQGFPDDPGPEDVRRIAADALLTGNNQYPPMMGLPALREAIAAHYQRWQGLSLDPGTEVMVTSGATEALAGALLALLEPGDEVILFQPMYDAYAPLVRRAGGTPKFVTLRPPDWAVPADDLANAITPKTRAILVNDPLNPAASTLSAPDRQLLARTCVENDLIAICDDVWEHVVFDGHRHTPLMAEPGMRERTVKIGSAGKMFSLTGWKVGLVCAAPALMKALARAHQFITFTTPPNLQTAVAYGLGKPDEWFEETRRGFAASRDHLANGLRDIGLNPLPSAGTYFLNVDLAPLGVVDDVAACRKLVTAFGVAAIPVSAFFETDTVRTVARFCFAKRRDTLDEALDRLRVAAPHLAE
jgi:N-succinyldiaminopimelate aminotransferase